MLMHLTTMHRRSLSRIDMDIIFLRLSLDLTTNRVVGGSVFTVSITDELLKRITGCPTDSVPLREVTTVAGVYAEELADERDDCMLS
jgi:hypothetical protein